MYLHLGQDVLIKKDDIIGIFDMETSTIAKATRNYLADSQKTGKVVTVSMEMPKSFVLCCNRKTHKITVYVSQISTSTLLKRTVYLEAIYNV